MGQDVDELSFDIGDVIDLVKEGESWIRDTNDILQMCIYTALWWWKIILLIRLHVTFKNVDFLHVWLLYFLFNIYYYIFYIFCGWDKIK